MYGWVKRQRVGNGAIFAGCLLIVLLYLLLLPPLSSAATGINQQLNYQARLLDNTGAVVPDGTYNMEFKIYQDGDGVLGGGDETLKWTETRTSGNKVTVKNGYFSVQLGSVTAFGTSVDWNQDKLWLSTNIGGTGTPTWDGEMSPFRRLGASAYAFNANRLGGLTASEFLQFAQGSAQTDSGINSSISVNKTGASGNILQLQKNGVDVVTINNSGLTTFNTDIDLSFSGTENIALNSDLADSANLFSVIGTPSSSAGTTRGFFVQQANHASNTNGLDAALYIDNADADLAIPAAISIQNSGAGGTPYTNIFDILGAGLSASELTVLDGGLAETEISGEIEAVTAGSGLTGGGTTDSVTIAVGGGNGITVNADDIAVRVGVTAADGSSTSSISGLEFVGGELSLLRGCAAGGILEWDNTNFEWDCGVDDGGGGGGVTTIGTIDSQTKSANGAVISGTSLVMQTADGSAPGLVSTGVQTFAGAKTLTGAATLQNTSDSTTAFRVLNASSVPLFVIDTTNSYVYVGNPTADGTAALLILDSKNTTGDPTGTAGAMYYNSANNKFRCYENTAWWDCVGAAGDRSRRKPVYSTDFLGPAGAATVESITPWDVTLISSGTQAMIAAEPSHPGILRISSSVTANSGGRIMTDILAYRLGGSETFECVFQPRVASNTNTTIRMGFLDATTSTDAVDGVYFELPAASLNIVGKTSSNSTRTTSSTVAALTVNTWYRAKIEVNSNATSVTFSIYNDSNTLLGSQTVSTNIPTASGRETGNGIIVTNSGTTATLLAYFDYMSTWQERVLTR